MKLRSLLPLLTATAFAGSAFAQAGDDTNRLMRDLRTVMQQRDTLIEQSAQATRERDALKGRLEQNQQELQELRKKVAELASPAAAANATEQALREAQMKADMTVRAYAIKDEEAQRAVQAASTATQRQAAAEAERDAALAEAKGLAAELATAKQSEAAALTARAQMQNELYAAQIRIENLARAVSGRSGAPTPPPATPAPTPLEAEAPPPAPVPVAQPRPEAPDKPRPEPVAADAGPRTHTVGEGETLSLLAFKYYGSPNKWDKIFNANRDKLKNPDQVRPGMVLKVP